MGHGLRISAIVISMILLSGVLAIGFSSDAYARHGGPGNGFAKGCDNQGVAKNNPHCTPPTPPFSSPCDTDSSGGIDAAELFAQYPSKTLVFWQTNLAVIDGISGDGSGFIDTASELVDLNNLLAANGLSPPC